MISFIKNMVLIVLVLVASQIPVNGKRICDHVGEVVGVVPLKNSLKWFSNKFDFREEKSIKAAQDHVGSNDRAVLSGLLKIRK